MSRVLPILFNTDMVQAILDGRKTVTRRVMKPQPLYYTGRRYIFADECCPKKWEDCDNIIETYQYQPDDILYVRETWSEWTDGYVYKAWASPFPQPGRYPDKFMKWHPSIHMPKAAARIWLKVTDVRVERLQDIDDEGAKSEGANWKNGKHVGFEEKLQRSSIERFAEIWDSTIKKDDLESYGWDANPLVWKIEFERCKKPEEL